MRNRCHISKGYLFLFRSGKKHILYGSTYGLYIADLINVFFRCHFSHFIFPNELTTKRLLVLLPLHQQYVSPQQCSVCSEAATHIHFLPFQFPDGKLLTFLLCISLYHNILPGLSVLDEGAFIPLWIISVISLFDMSLVKIFLCSAFHKLQISY